MARKAKSIADRSGQQAPQLSKPKIYEATCQAGGSVVKGAEIQQAAAEARRKSGLDVVVCGSDHKANKGLAESIEQNANGHWRRCPPHANAGPMALPHYQPDPRPPDGHTFYETKARHAQ